MVILGKTKLIDAIKEHPEIKDKLISLSDKFKKLKNPFIFSTLSRWATFSDIAKIGNLSICELLHEVNSFLGTEKELLKLAPECIKEAMHQDSTEKPEWIEESKEKIIIDTREREDFFFPEINKHIQNLKKGQILQIINNFYPAPLINMLKELEYEYYYEEIRLDKHILYINYKDIIEKMPWLERKDQFEVMDVRGWDEDPFSAIIKKANDMPVNTGFKLIQYFVPTSLINMMEPLGFESYVEQKDKFEHHIYFYKKEDTTAKSVNIKSGRIPLVIQSATPVAYPIIMKVLQSRRLMDMIKIEELKVWDKTENHLAWIVNKKADISFSAVAAVSNLYQNDLDIKMKAIVIWDNFYLLTRGYKAETFADLKGHKIHLPLIKTAPPFAVTRFLMEKYGLNTNDFEFEFGKPFGRPEEIKNKLVKGEIDTGLLREPEASFAIYEGNGNITESIAYKNIWNELFPGKGNLPNAGVLFKGEIIKKYPELVNIFLEETENAIKWINENKEESANLSYEIMGVTPDEAKLFLERVNFNYAKSEDVYDEIVFYLDVLNKSGYGRKEFGDLKNLFI